MKVLSDISITAGVILPPVPSSPINFAPPVKNSGELHSSQKICASPWQSIAPCPGVIDDSARPLAAVPVVTRKACTSRPKTSDSISSDFFERSSPRIGRRRAGIGFAKCRQNLGVNAIDVVGREIHMGKLRKGALVYRLQIRWSRAILPGPYLSSMMSTVAHVPCRT